MSSGLVFRKDCADCGRNFFTPDRKVNLCPRCAGKNQKRAQRAEPKDETPSKPLSTSKASTKARSPSAGPDDLMRCGPKEFQIHKQRGDLQGGKGQEVPRKPEATKRSLAQTPDRAEEEIALTEEQEQEIIRRYQAYVKRMEKLLEGRRKRIASEMDLPYRAIVLAVRNWNRKQKDLSREERFQVEKSYFRLLEKEASFAGAKEQITRETGLDEWQVSRYLDLLHDGEERLLKVPDVLPEQKTAVLAEYHSYLAASAPPALPLHTLIAERTGVTPKQVHKVLLSYRLSRFLERWK